MGKVKGMTAAMLLGCAALVLPVSASGTDTQIDAEPIQDGKISAAQLQKGDTLQYSFSVKNTQITSPVFGSTVVRITWSSEGGQTIIQDIEKLSKDNTFHGELKIEEGMQPGKWKIDNILFPNPRPYVKVTSLMQEWDGIKVLGQGGSLTSVVDDLSFSEFTVQGTKADGKAPVVRKKSVTLAKKAVKKKEKTKLYVKASDKSPMRYVSCVWRNTATKELLYGDMNYNRKKGRYEYTLSASKIGKKGKLRLICVEACDKYGNKTTLKNRKLPRLIISRK
ncbi:MAG: hypothetical protein K2P21_11310 [Lachnospiraceae bacterium]|nr:hypothetical protein [Lachnospiraceae bacterium]